MSFLCVPFGLNCQREHEVLSWFGLFSLGLQRGCICCESEAPAIATAFRRAGLKLNLSTDGARAANIWRYLDISESLQEMS